MRHFTTLSSLLCLSALLLGGCVDTAVDLGASRAANSGNTVLTARPDVSPRGASVAITSLEGAPDEVTARFKRQFSNASESRDITLKAPETAQYRLRGYLTCSATTGGARMAYVWDVFDKKGRRAQRLMDEVTLAGNGEPWAALDEKTSAEIAGRAADNVAAFLSNTPEAIAAMDGAGSGMSVVAAQGTPAVAAKSTPPLGYAEAK